MEKKWHYMDEICLHTAPFTFFLNFELPTASLSGGGFLGCPGASTFGTACP